MPSAGDSFLCSSCGRESIFKSKRILDGWTVVRECLVCAFCGAETTAPSENGAPADPGLQKLATLLGEDSGTATTPSLAPEPGSRFCKDCRHFLRHPFLSRCLLHNRATEPMDDCADFAPRPDHEESGEENA
jgi:hypothetical protein